MEILTVPLNIDIETVGGYVARIRDYYPCNRTLPLIGCIYFDDFAVPVAWRQSGWCTAGGGEYAAIVRDFDIDPSKIREQLFKKVSSLMTCYVKTFCS